MLGDSLGSTDSKVIVSYEGIKIRSTNGTVFGTIIVNLYGIKLGVMLEHKLAYLDGSFYGSNDGKVEILFL